MGGGSRTLPGVEEIIGGSQVTSHEDTGHNRQDSGLDCEDAGPSFVALLHARGRARLHFELGAARAAIFSFYLPIAIVRLRGVAD